MFDNLISRPPHGGRGLKSFDIGALLAMSGSSPTRGTWIEISSMYVCVDLPVSRPPHGGRGLKYTLP